MTAQTGWAEKYRADGFSRAELDRLDGVGSFRETLNIARPGMRVLEAGSGTGRMMVRLARDVDVQAVGVDSEPEALELSRRLAEAAAPLTGTASFVLGDLYSLPFEDGSFDVVVSDSVIEHLERPAVAMREMARVLVSGGAAVVAVPNRWRPDGWDLYRRLARPPYRQSSFTPRQLRREMQDAGFELVRYFGDELWLRRNVQLLRTAVGDGAGRRSMAPATAAAPARASSAGPSITRHVITSALRTALPARLHVNVGLVARKR